MLEGAGSLLRGQDLALDAGLRRDGAGIAGRASCVGFWAFRPLIAHTATRRPPTVIAALQRGRDLGYLTDHWMGTCISVWANPIVVWLDGSS
jgi:hypothetical protein